MSVASLSTTDAAEGPPPATAKRFLALRIIPSPSTLVASAIFLALSVVAFWPVAPWSNSAILSANPHDSITVGWFLASVGYAVIHGHNPFFSHFLELPVGVNLAANQSMPLLGLIATPLTLIFGPFGMINLLMRLTFFSSALSMYLVGKRYAQRRLPVFFGALFFGFSPTLVAHNLENQNFSFLPTLPVMFLLVDNLLNHPEKDARRTGVLLGLVCAIQLYLNPEVLAEVAVVVGASAACVVVARLIRRRNHLVMRLVAALAATAVVFVVLGIPFIYYYFFGPQHIDGPVAPLSALAIFHTDLLAPIVPMHNQLLAPASLAFFSNHFTGGAINETGSYLGGTLIVGLGYFIVRYRHNATVCLAALATLFGFVFSLGPDLVVNNHDTGIPMPERILTHLPAISSAEAIRYFLVADLAIAFILVIGLDRAFSSAFTRGSFALPERRPIVVAGATVALAVALLVPVIPRWPYSFVSTSVQGLQTSVPPYFTSPAVNAIAQNDIAITFPLAQSGYPNAEVWQLATHFRFRLIWGYAYVADNGGVFQGNPPFTDSTLPDLESYGLVGSPTPPVTMTIINLKAIRNGLGEFHPDVFLMQPIGTDPQIVEQFVSAALGEKPVDSGGMLVWYHLPERLRTGMKSVLLADHRLGILKTYPPRS
jgi:hypothetical protein